jgi:hypothetical protein
MANQQTDPGAKIGTTPSSTPTYQQTNGCCPCGYEAFIYLAMSDLSEAELKQMMAFSKEMALAAQSESKTVNTQVQLGVASAKAQQQATTTEATYGLVGAGVTAGALAVSAGFGMYGKYSGKELESNKTAFNNFNSKLAGGNGGVQARAVGAQDPDAALVNDKVEKISTSRTEAETFMKEVQNETDQTKRAFNDKVIGHLKSRGEELGKVRSYSETMIRENNDQISSNENAYSSFVRGMQSAGDAGNSMATNAGKIASTEAQLRSSERTAYAQGVQSLNSAIAAVVSNSQQAADEAEAKAAQAANFGDIKI